MDKVIRSLYAGFAAILVHVLLLHSSTCMGGDHVNNSSCAPSSCGNIRDIRSPFRLIGDPENCGDHRYNLSCENNLTVLYLLSGRYYVQEINYTCCTIRLVDAGIQKDDCSSIPRYTLTDGHYLDPYDAECERNEGPNLFNAVKLTKPVIYLKCANPVSSPLYVSTASCINNKNATNTSSSNLAQYSYVHIGRGLNFLEWRAFCQIEQMSLIASNGLIHEEDKNYLSYEDIHNQLVYGFELSWLRFRETSDLPSCYLNRSNQVQCYSDRCGNYFYLKLGFAFIKICADDKRIIPRFFYTIGVFCQYHLTLLGVIIGPYIITRILLGTIFPMVVLIYRWRRRHLSMYDTIEDFLQSNNNLMPIRYSYSDIKKMTKGFQDKLGEGGYGSVFKGKLRSGRFVAIKMLGKSNANGQDFINEVATIGRIHHVNVVQLIGFCAEGSKRALVYELMANGSLDKCTFFREGSVILSNEQMLEISLGVARGIDYLHQGCNMQILHFDIKPHNILLDENLNPKVSDFGLARLCPLDKNVVTLTAARGTMGYIAPELFYKNIGGVSHKADVYSFGMLLMEMASRRKNLNAVTDQNTSQIYFPTWVYDQFNEGKDIEIELATEDELKRTKKMMIVALWCIQLKPSDRPSMNEVVKMLEGEDDCLQMPPKPFFCPQDEPPIAEDGGVISNPTMLSGSSSQG